MAATLGVEVLFTLSGLAIPDVVTGWICAEDNPVDHVHRFVDTIAAVDYFNV